MEKMGQRAGHFCRCSRRIFLGYGSVAKANASGNYAFTRCHSHQWSNGILDKPLLIYFWATWCGVCKLTSPMVEGLHSDGMNVLSVAIRSGDNERLMRGMTAKGITFPVVNDELGRLSAEWNISATPTFVILEQGKMVSSTSGWSSAWGVKFRMWWADARIFSNLAD